MKFFIGNYEDEVYFDVLPMDVCHFLLGRPWQSDRHIHHDGRKNTYTLIKNGVKYVLNPLKDVPPNVQSSSQISLLSYKEFEQSYKEDGITYALVAVERSEEVANEISIEVLSLLEKFKGLARDELMVLKTGQIRSGLPGTDPGDQAWDWAILD